MANFFLKSFKSIRSRILLLLTLIFLIVIGITIHRVIERRDSDTKNVNEKMQLHAQLITENQRLSIRHTQQYMNMLVDNGELSQLIKDPKCSETLNKYIQKDIHFANILIADLSGTFICSAVPNKASVSIRDRTYFQKALVNSEVVIGEASIGRIIKRRVIPFARQFRDASGVVRGVLVITLDLEWVNKEFAKYDYPAGSRIGIADRAGNVWARYPDPENLVGKNAANLPAMKAMIAQNGKGTAELPAFDGITRIYAFSNFTETSGGPLYLWIGIPKEIVTSGANRQFIEDLIITLLVATLAFIAVWLSTEKLFIRPMEGIINAIRLLKEGDHQARSGIPHTNDEVGQLARDFDEMAVALLSKSDILRLNRSLKIISEGNRVLVHAQNEQQLINDVCRVIVETGDYPMAWIGYAENDIAKSVRPAASYGDDGYLETAKITWDDSSPRGCGPTGLAIRTNQLIINHNFESNQSLKPWLEEAHIRGYRSSSAFPLMSNGKAFGTLTIYSSENDPFNNDEIVLMQQLAADLSFGIISHRLRETHEQSQAMQSVILNTIPQAVFWKDTQGKYLGCNTAFAKTAGFVRPDDIIGKTDFDLPWTRNEAEVYRQDDYRVISSNQAKYHIEEVIHQADGKRIDVDTSKIPLVDSSNIPYGVLGIFEDITERKLAADALEASEERFKLSMEATRDGLWDWNAETNEVYYSPACYHMLGYQVGDFPGTLKAWQDLLHPDDIEHTMKVNMACVEGLSETISAEYRLKTKNGDWRWVLGRGKSISRDSNGRSLRLVGTNIDITDRKQTENEIATYLRKLKSAMKGTLLAVSNMVEQRDPYTSGHERRVGIIASDIAREMGWPDDKCENLQEIGLVHDIGKIAIPAEMLSKPTRLTPLEYEIIKTHAETGYEILKDIEFPIPIAEIIRQHHERMNGSGYPRGLKGEEILLEARILAVADVIESMSSHRPYRTALGIDLAIEEIEKHRGELYDELVVDTILKMIRDNGYKLPG